LNGIGIGSRIISQSKTHYKSLLNQKQEKMADLEQKLAELWDSTAFFMTSLDFPFLKTLDVHTTSSLVPLQTSSPSYEDKKQWQKLLSLVYSWFRHLECWQMQARPTLKARVTISLPSCRFTLDQNFLSIPTSLTIPLPSLPSLV